MKKLTTWQKEFIAFQIDAFCLEHENKLVNQDMATHLKEIICNRDEDFVDDFEHLHKEDDSFRVVNKIGLALCEALHKPQYNKQRDRLMAIYNNDNFVYTKELEEEVDEISEYIKKTKDLGQNKLLFTPEGEKVDKLLMHLSGKINS